MATNVGASTATKLKNYARENGLDMLTVLRRYAQERLLYRLSVSPEADRFCLKGGLLLAAYNNGDLLRPTEDIDFNGFDEDGSVELLEESLRVILAQPVEDDGVIFLPETMRVTKDREGILSGGKVVLTARIHTAKVDVRVDVGFGNAITPDAKPMEIPTLLPGMAPRPVVAAYPMETVIAEKLHAMVQHGLINTRMKDYFDLWRISETLPFEGQVLADAVASTFRRQQRPLPAHPQGLSDGMVESSGTQWQAFVRKQKLDAPLDFGEVVARVGEFLIPVIAAARLDCAPPADWTPGSGWSPSPGMTP
jgi:predicted nucleotidyltransferase component of viral defense system